MLATGELGFSCVLNSFCGCCHLSPLVSTLLCCAERHAKVAQQGARRIVVLRSGHNGDVHPLELIDLCIVDLREDQLITQSKRVIAASIKRLRRHATEVSHTRKYDVDKPVEELVHVVPAKCNHRADGLSL